MQFIAAIGELYAVEATWCDAEPARHMTEERLRLRQARSVPVLARVQAPLLANLHAVRSGSVLGNVLH